MAELLFTGERVVPGRVDADLWNEHYARYLFASRFARGERVLDLGCGAGYGAALMAESAVSVTGIDLSAEAVEYARTQYNRANLQFRTASCTATGLPDASFDLITAFEIIEHLDDWPKLLSEVRRMLAPDGQFFVSTPNKHYYGEAREGAGANPYHVHEFELAEFEAALRDMFPSVSLYTQNHTSATVLQPFAPSGAAELRIESSAAEPESAHFYFAICALVPQMGASAFVHVPRTANMLREREMHIANLEVRNVQLGERMVAVQTELETSQKWAAQSNADLDLARQLVAQLQAEAAAQQAAAHKAINDLQQRYDQDIAEANRVIEETNRTIVERSEWALGLDAQLNALRGSRWHRLGRKLGVRSDS